MRASYDSSTCRRSGFARGIALTALTAWSFAHAAGAATPIASIQGSGHLSPLTGQAVQTAGIVTAIRANGFYLQDPIGDSDVATSEGIFVFTSSAPTVSVGDSLTVTGTVSEFRPGGAASVNLTVTQLSGPIIVVHSTGNALPAPVVLGAGGRAIPATVIDDDATGDVETTGSFDAATDGIDFMESLEGMRVQINNPVAASPTLTNFQGLPVLADNGAGAGLRTTRGGVLVRSSDANPERLILNRLVSSQVVPQVNTGASLTTVTAIVDYVASNYQFYVTAMPTVVSNSLTPEITSVQGGNQRLSIAAYNTANLDATDPAARFEAVAQQIVSQLLSPDIISLADVQDNNGPTNDATTAANLTYQALIDAIAAVGGPVYQYREIAPVDDQDGGEPGGNSRVGFLFNPARVAFVDRPGGSATTAAQVLSGPDGVQLLNSPARIAPLDTAWSANRKPLVGEFVFNSHTVFVIGAQFNSIGGDNPLFGRYQPPVRITEVQRNAQAAVVSSFVQQIRGLDPEASIVVLGDLNAAGFSDAITVLKTGSGLVNLTDTLPEADRYNLLFEGNSLAFSHVLVSPSIAEAGNPVVDIVHSNADFVAGTSLRDPIVATMTIGAVADSTPPVITSSVVGTGGNNGWFTSDVSVSWTVFDAESTVTSSSGCTSTFITEDTAGTTLTCTATSAGGTNSDSVVIARDATAPTATATPAPLPNPAGWNKTSVTVSYSGSDALSGIDSCSPSTMITAEGADQTSSSGTCTDKAGNVSAPVSVTGIDIDKTLPVVTATAAPQPNASGWNTTSVSVTFTAIDALSGVAVDGCDAPKTLSNDGAGQSATGTCRDLAGNQGTGSVNGIDIDKTAPVAVATPAPAPNANGWNNTDVTVSFAATDGMSGSGVAGCSANVTLTAEAAGIVSTGTCSDVAGNTSAEASATTSIDKTAPSAAIVSPANGATYVQGASVAASYQCSDALAGIAQCAGPVADGAAIDTATAGPKSFSVNALDRAGNASTASAAYTVVALNDTTAPVIVPVVTGKLGTNGWYRGNVSVSWSVSDAESAITSKSGCAAVTIKRDTTSSGTTLTCVATSAGGTATRSVLIKRDATAPTIALLQPNKDANYVAGQVVLAQYSCQDSLSGLAKCAGTVASGAAIDTRPSPTARQFTVSAADQAGNVATTKVSYQVQ